MESRAGNALSFLLNSCPESPCLSLIVFCIKLKYNWYQCRLVKQIPLTLITPYPALPPVGEGFGMGVCKYKFFAKIIN